jgi:hypothetical protein
VLLWCISSHSRPAHNLTMPFPSRQVPLHRLCPFHLDRQLRQAEADQVNDTAVQACQGPTGRCEPLLGAGCTRAPLDPNGRHLQESTSLQTIHDACVPLFAIPALRAARHVQTAHATCSRRRRQPCLRCELRSRPCLSAGY